MKVILLNQTSWTDILTAIGTVGAVLISLALTFYKEWWEPKWRKAHLVVSIDPAYSFAVDSSQEAIMSKGGEEMFIAGKIRFRVEHTKGNPAKNVEVFINKVWDIEFGKRKQRQYFFPTSLLWSGRKEEQTAKSDFAPNTVRFCDFGIYANNWDNYTWELHVTTSEYAGDPEVEKFSNVLPIGAYELEMLVTGEGVEPTISYWHVEIDGGWSDKEEIMFSKHFKIKKI